MSVLRRVIDRLKGRTGILLGPGDTRRRQIEEIKKRAKLVIKK